MFGILLHTSYGDCSGSGHDDNALPKGVQVQCIRLSSGKEPRLTIV